MLGDCRIERLAEKETGPVSELQIDGLAAFGRMHKLKKAGFGDVGVDV